MKASNFDLLRCSGLKSSNLRLELVLASFKKESPFSVLIDPRWYFLPRSPP